MSEATEGFDKTLEELERLVVALEAEDLDLEEALRLFELGIERLRQAAASLDGARGRVEELIRSVEGEVEAVDMELTDGQSSEPDVG